MRTAVLLQRNEEEFAGSAIKPQTIKAYLETHYCVAGVSPFIMQIGITIGALAKLHKKI